MPLYAPYTTSMNVVHNMSAGWGIMKQLNTLMKQQSFNICTEDQNTISYN